MKSFRNNDAARRFAERRRREDEAPRLHAEVPALVTLDLTFAERKGDATGETSHVRRVVVASAPALFEITCGDASCLDGGHDLTHMIMRALRDRRTAFDGEDVCHGNVGAATCARVLRYTGAANYRS